MTSEIQSQWDAMVKAHRDQISALTDKVTKKEISKAFYFQEIERLTNEHLKEIKELLGDE